MIDLLPLVNKTVTFKFSGAELRFDLSHALFSSFDIDQGTRLLLKAIARDPVLARARRILDSGCGTGIIGLAIAKAFPEAEVIMRDRDSLAVAFSERNRLLNRLKGRSAWTDPETGALRTAVAAPRAELGLLSDFLRSDGAGDPRSSTAPFDFVVSNLPAKAGAPVLASFFARAGGRDGGPGFLAPGGRLAVVIVNTLADKAREWIEAAGLVSVSASPGTGHSVFIVERAGEGAGAAPGAVPVSDGTAAAAPGAVPVSEGSVAVAGAAPGAVPLAPGAAPGAVPGAELDLSGLDLSAYLRGESGFTLVDVAYRARGFWGLPDFDTVGYAAVLAAEAASRGLAGALVRDALIINPGAGHFAVWAARKLGCARLAAASRDLLSLAATGANLAFAGGRRPPVYRALDEIRLDELAGEEHSLDLLAEFPDTVPEYDWIGLAWDRATRLVKIGGSYLAACPPTEIARLLKRRPSGWRLAAERRRRGYAAMLWTRTA